MSIAAETSDPERLEEKANAARDEVDRTLDALEQRFSVRRKAGQASRAIGAAASRAYRNLTPGITSLIRLDHTHVLAAFRRYRRALSAVRKQAVVENACLALEIHAQLEEEIFYPALLSCGGDAAGLDRSVSEHKDMRVQIAELRELPPDGAGYDQAFLRLIRTALHHVAEEETITLPFAEKALAPQLRELGWKMTVRRVELLKPHAASALRTTALTFPVLSAVAVAAVLTAAWLLVRGAAGPRRGPR